MCTLNVFKACSKWGNFVTTQSIDIQDVMRTLSVFNNQNYVLRKWLKANTYCQQNQILIVSAN